MTQHALIRSMMKSEKTPFPMLDGREIALAVFGGPPPDDAYPKPVSEAVDRFFRLGASDRANATKKLVAYCNDFCDALGVPRLPLGSPDDIWKHVTEISALIESFEDDPVEVRLACEISIDEEHGVVLVYRDGHQLSKVEQG